MSFILDALKKSDKKRQEVSAPRLDTVHASAAKTRPRKSSWGLLIGVVLLLNLGLLGWFFLRPPEPVANQESRPAQPAGISTRAAPLASPAVPADAEVRPQAEPQQPLREPATRQQPEAWTSTSSEGRVSAISDLPVDVQRRIPALHMSLHAYNKANPAAGMVRVNDQILRPGAKLDGKYRLEEISLEGAVFLFEGHRFILPRD